MRKGHYPWLKAAWQHWGQAIAEGATEVEIHRQSGMSRHKCRILIDRVRRYGAAPIDDPVAAGAPPKGQTGEVWTAPPREETAPPPPSERGSRFEQDGISATAEHIGRIKTLDELIDACDIDLDVWRVRSYRVNKWEVGAKDPATGEIRTEELFQVRADLERRLADVVAPPYPTYDLPAPRLATSAGRIESTVFIPDAQIGFRWQDNYNRLEPMHDRVAMDAVLQVIQLLQPDNVIILGDMLDLAPWSTKYPRPMDVHDTSNPSFWELHWWLCQIRQAAPHADITFLEGNHEERIMRALVEKLPEASTLREVGSEHEALSIPKLLHLDALGIDYIAPYGEHFWLHDRVLIAHGEVARATVGGTARTLSTKVLHSMVYGHIHRVEMVQRRLQGPSGSEVVSIMSPGCLCRTDAGAVPGVTRHPDWQQGLGVSYYDQVTDRVHMYPVSIDQGFLVWEGNLIEGRDRSDEISAFCGIPQMRNSA